MVARLAVFRDYAGTPDREIMREGFYRAYPELGALAQRQLEELRRE